MSIHVELPDRPESARRGLARRPFTAPHLFRDYAIIFDLIQRQVPKWGKVLDLGCGTGWTCWFLSASGFDVVGVDPSERKIAIGRARLAGRKRTAQLMVSELHELVLPDRDFDAVLMYDSLRHCEDSLAALRQASDHLRPGGSLILIEPTRSPSPRHAANVRRVFTRRHLRRQLRQAGFRSVTPHVDPGGTYRGLLGFLWAHVRLWWSYVLGYPDSRMVLVAVK